MEPRRFKADILIRPKTGRPLTPQEAFKDLRVIWARTYPQGPALLLGKKVCVVCKGEEHEKWCPRKE